MNQRDERRTREMLEFTRNENQKEDRKGNPMTEVLVYTTSTWPWSRRAREYLAARGLSFEVLNVEHDQEAYRQMIETTGWKSAPVLKVGESWILGFHPPTIERALTQAGLGAGGRL